MNQNWKKYVALAMAVVVFSGCGATTPADTDERKKTEANSEQKNSENMSNNEKQTGETKNKGVAAPEFTLKDWDGNEVALADLKGKKVYLKFWASWCHFCVEGMPDLAKLVEEDNDFEIYTIVAPDYSGEKSIEDFKKWYEEKGFSRKIKVLFEEKENNGEIMRAYSVSGYPTNAFIGTDGILVSKLPGNANNDQIKERMAAIQ